MRATKVLFAAAAIVAVLGAARASAQSPAEFYKGKTVEMMIGHHFSISACCRAPSACGVCSWRGGISCARLVSR